MAKRVPKECGMDIDGFLLSNEFLGVLAELVTAFLNLLLGQFLGQALGG